MKRIAVTGVVMLVVISCSENFPRRLDDVEVVADASTDAPADADIDGAVADASVDSDVADDASTDADAFPPIDGSAGCNVRTASPGAVESPHVTQGSVVSYGTNPPSSGPHYPSWANFIEFGTVVPDGNLVHSLEHGAVLLLYNCNAAEPACTKVIEDLRAVRDAIPDDPGCQPHAPLRVRVIIAPRPANDTAVAAAAWGETYRADCVDVAGLTQWVKDHYAKAPEDFCNPGQSAF